jgi:CHASE3 domain sensor protein
VTDDNDINGWLNKSRREQLDRLEYEAEQEEVAARRMKWIGVGFLALVVAFAAYFIW